MQGEALFQVQYTINEQPHACICFILKFTMEDSPQIARSEKPTSSDADDAVTIRNETDEDVTSDPDSRPPSISPTVFSATTTLRDQSSREPQEVLPSDVIFAFGPSDYYFLYRHQPIGTKIM